MMTAADAAGSGTSSREASRRWLAGLGIETLAEILDRSLDAIAISDASRRFLYVNPVMAELIGAPPDAMLGQDIVTVIAPRARTSMQQYHESSLAGSPGRRSSVILCADGTEREIEYTSLPITIGGQPAVTSIARDVTEMRRQSREALALVRITGALTLDQTLEEVLEAVVAGVVEATDADACCITVIDASSERLQTLRARGLPGGFTAAMEAT